MPPSPIPASDEPTVDLGEGRVAGSVERVTFHSTETGFCVLRVKAKGHRHPVAVVGHAAAVNAGEYVEADGTWVNDRTYGIQFQAAALTVAAPTSVDGLERYLGSGLIHGIGPVCARRLVDSFGAAILEVIAHEPERLRAVEGVGPWRARRIVEAWAEQQAMRAITLFLDAHGVGAARVLRIYRTYGPDAIARITADPYCLARDIRGFGFPTADGIAARLGIAADSPLRLRAGIAHALQEAALDGHCGLPVDELARRAGALLGARADAVRAVIADAVAFQELTPATVDGERCVFLTALDQAERAIGRRLCALATASPPWGAIDADRAVQAAEAGMGVTLAASQRAALNLALASKVAVITGGPGTGKTTLVNGILQALEDQDMRIALCAPTGRAAKRLSESTGREARTIHRLLDMDAFDGAFRRGPMAPVEADLLVVDESSMVDVRLMHALLRAVPDHTALLLVGDVDQIPSIGPGQVLADVIASGALPVVRLTEVFRQAAESRIVESAHRINAGETPDLEPADGSDFYFVEADGPEAATRKLVTLVRERIPERFGLDPARDVQVLCPMNRGSLGVRALNLTLQAALNPPGATRVDRFGWTYGPGDKVMQVQNNYERDVYNGEVGTVSAVDPEAAMVTVAFEGREVAYAFDELDELVLAYATTIHKAQGSEYPAVVIPLTLQHGPMLRRNLLYTGVTRGRRLVVLLGSREALRTAIADDVGRRRWSRLKGWLEAYGASVEASTLTAA